MRGHRIAGWNRSVPFQHRGGLNPALVLHVLRLQHALVIAQQSRWCENRFVAETGRFQKIIVSAATNFSVAVTVTGTVADSRNVIVVFGNIVLVLAGAVQSRMTKSLRSVTFGSIGIIRQIALVQIKLLEVLSDI